MDASRMSGLISGFDTDTKVQDLMKTYQHRVDRVEQDKTWVEWQQEEYRNTISDINSFQNSYFDILNSESNLRSPRAFNEFESSVTLGGTDTPIVSVSGQSHISDFNHKISEISQLATADTWRGDSVIPSIEGEGLHVPSVNDLISNGYDTIGISVDGTTRNITLSGNYDTAEDLATDLQEQINTTFGDDVMDISVDGGELQITPGAGHSVRLLSVDAGVLENIGFSSGDKNYISTTGEIHEVFDLAPGETFEFAINGEEFSFSSDTTVREFMNTVNSSQANVNLTYNSLENRFILMSDETGVSNNISLDDTDGFFADQLQITNSTNPGQNAQFTLNGVTTTRSSNTFEIDNVRYELNNTYDGNMGDIDIEISTDTQAIIDKITSFVDDYNALIEDINAKTGERRSFEHRPLTVDQRRAMDEHEIELWEEQARRGLLGRDTQLESMTTQMRRALADPVEGVSITLSDLGITTSRNYLERGKLEVDEDKLRQALDSNYNEVVNLFTQTSSVRYNDWEDRATRRNEQGIAERLNDIMQDYTRTTRDNNGQKGILVERAGVEGDTSFSNNTLSKQLKEFDTRIADLERTLAEREAYYYNLFASMEQAMARMDSQAGALMNMM
ncbi:flagellar filament capping protein FliD [Chitinivibrio alkaliphilus]|uniref:Flagellar hook-associated protein 2 n=1 Tax=Chitinivibrio alkaliphilus ACht1 TaxID=1313304 RepID=U7DBS5_9BACT|nr:flagellar filament capping protein FliD [Chitinivibrio alkaliphilus]ERP31855.1 flagellar hook-associated protein FliD [Chitinivibrio alkaliphilus ACht1]